MYKLPENEELLFHYLSGAASDKEKQSIYEWINQSKENKEYFDKVKADYILMVQASRANLISKNNFDSLLGTIKRRRQIRIAVATSISLLLVLFFSINYSFKDYSDFSEVETLSASQEQVQIRPGSNTAILQLSTGEQIDIKNKNEAIKDGSGTEININDEGEISYKSASGNNKTQEIRYNKLIVPRGGEYMIKLSDGTQVWLNSASELKYPVEFIGETRTVYLKGEAYFDVAKNKKQPFRVCVDNVNLTVLGTAFNVNTHTTGVIETVLVNGSVEINSGAGRKTLKPNERGVIKEGSNNIEVDEVDVTSFIAWKNGDFVFHNESLERIMEKLSLWYNVDVNFRTESMKGIKLSGEMTRGAEIHEILYFFEKISNAKFSVKEGCIIVNEMNKI